MTQPGVVAFSDTLLDNYNPFSSGNPSLAYGAITGGIQQAVSANAAFGSIQAVVLLDLYRITKTSGTNGAAATLWHNANSITATYSDNTYAGPNSARADYLGTIAIDAGGNLHFVAAGLPPEITSSNSANGTIGVPFSYQIEASNTPTSYGAVGLPSGLTANSSTGHIAGTPDTQVIAAATISATNKAGTGSRILTITISPTPTTITTQRSHSQLQ